MNFIYFLLATYCLLCILLFFFQERLIFFPQKLPLDHTFLLTGDFEERYFQVDETTTIHTLHFYAENPKGVILYFHGNAGSLEGWGDVANDFVQLGYDVLISDYRSFGKSTGKISEEGLYQDGQLLYDFLLEKYDPTQITIFGRSLGTGVATHLAANNPAKRLILETPFSNFIDLAQSKFKIFPVKFLSKFKFENNKKNSKIKYPIHIFHGTKDFVIPYQNAVQLKTLLKEENAESGLGDSFITIENGGHNNLFTSKLYWEQLKMILK